MLSLFFVLSVIATVVSIPLFPLQFFFPFMALVALRLSHVKALWISALCGIVLDLLSSGSTFGFHACIFAMTMTFLYPYRRYFFEDKCFPFLFYSTLFSLLNSLCLAMSASFTAHHLQWDFYFITTDLLLLPICDALSGYLLFVLPKLTLRFFKRFLLQWRLRAS
ncbi:MAG: hypothetical protein KGZ39_04790 [Simkania sp.]|nr:hypothetical protein [Simkania sp.]